LTSHHKLPLRLGIGRYLYSLPGAWEDWDADKKCFANERAMRAALALNVAMGKAAAGEAEAASRNGAGRAPTKPKPPAPWGKANDMPALTKADAASRKCTAAELNWWAS
jgi:hypothetical protein